ncbi:MAG: GGDEF domain-containing protein, partial [Candidatus Obscuribacterales bacterium]|nr:GGDEF domain-containing protein [Candidatus Obscuribacterales bacterium]
MKNAVIYQKERLVAAKSIIKSFYIKLSVVLVIGIPSTALLWDLAGPAALKGAFSQQAQDLSNSILKGNNVSASASDALSPAGAAWWVLIGPSGARVRTIGSYPTKMINSQLEGCVQVDSKRYYQSVVQLPNDRKAIVGFPCTSILTGGIAGIESGVPLAAVWYMVLANAGLGMLTVQLSLLGPLAKLKKQIKESDDQGNLVENSAQSNWASSEVSDIAPLVKDLVAKVAGKFSKDITHARADVRDLFQRELEDKFIDKLTRLIPELSSTRAACDRIVFALQNEFTQALAFSFVLNVNSSMQMKLLASENIADDDCKKLVADPDARLASKLRDVDQVQSLSQEDLSALGLSWIDKSIERLHLVRLGEYHETMIVLGCASRCDGETRITIERYLKSLRTHLAPILHLFLKFEREFSAARTDVLTGLPNRKHFEDFIEEISAIAGQKGDRTESQLLLLEGDNFAEMNKSFGREQTDGLLKEVATLIKGCIKTKIRKLGIRPEERLFRYGACQFMLFLEDCTSHNAAELADIIAATMAEKTDWPSSLSNWTLSGGISSFTKTGSESYQDAVKEAEIALEYVRSISGKGQICNIGTVPSKFIKSKKVTKIAGDLESMQAGNVLHSFAQNKSNGVLNCVHEDGRKFWMLILDGVPKKAVFGNLCGNDAVIEFLSTFETGNFQFEQMGHLSEENTDDLVQVESAVTEKMENLIQTGSIYKDHYRAAQRVVSTPTLILMALPQSTNPMAWQQITALPDAPDDRVITLMQT